MFLLLLLVPYTLSTLSTSLSPSPPPLRHSKLSPETQETLQTAVPDLHQNVFTAGTVLSTAFFTKYTPNGRISWHVSFPSVSMPSLVYEARYGLYGLIAVNITSEEADIVLLKLNEQNGQVTKQAVVQRVRIVNELTMKLVLVSAEQQQAFIYVVYIVQDGVNPSLAKTRLVQLKDVERSFDSVWKVQLTEGGKSARSVAATAGISQGSILIAETVRAMDEKEQYDVLTVFEVIKQSVNRSASQTVAKDAQVSYIDIDNSGAMYIAMRPNYYKMAMQDLDGETKLSILWSVENNVIHADQLRNGSASYVLSERDGIGNIDSQTVRVKVPVVTMLDNEGHELLRAEYEKKVPDVYHRFYSLHLMNAERSGEVLLTGHARFLQSGTIAAMARVEFPSLGQKDGGEVIVAPVNPIEKEQDSSNRSLFLGIGVGIGILVFVTLLGVALWFTHRRGAEPEEEMQPRFVEKEYHVLV